MVRLRVEDVMTSNLLACTANTRLEDVARMMNEMDCGAIPIIDHKNSLLPVGIITDRDIVSRTLGTGVSPFGRTVGSFMTRTCYTINQYDSFYDAIKMMMYKRVRRLPVLDINGQCCGILSVGDVAANSTDGKVAKLVRVLSKTQYRSNVKIA